MRRLEIKILGNKHVAKQLDKHLRSEISKTIGPGLPAIKKILKTLKFDHEKLKDTDLNTVIKEKLLAKAGTSPSIKKQIKSAIKILEASPRSAVIKDILRLDTPLNEHPLLAEDFRKAKALEFAKIIKLNNKKKANDLANKLEEHKLDIDKANSATLNEFVKDGIMTEKQKKELLITIGLSRLSGGNIELIEAVKNDKLKSLEDFVTWDMSDWAELITDNKIPVPESEEGAESYADNIRKNIEKTFPTPYFLKRVIKKKNKYNPEIKLLDSVSALYKRNDTIIEGTSINTDKFNWTGISNAKKENIEKDLDKFISFANTYRELGVAEIVNDKTLNTNKKRTDAITDRLANLETFYKNNTNIDLALTDFADNRARFNWDDIPEGERPRVRKQLMVYQRLFNLTEDSETARKMLDKGYSSGFDIIDTAEGDFIKTSGLDKEKGRDVYSNAMKTTTAASHLFEVVRDIHSGLFQEFAVSNQASMLNVFRDYDGYEELFGSQNFCDCAHCKSILGPAAYFTDLMYFVQKNVSKEVFEPNHLEHDLYLGSRRPDLWELELTCQNTSTEIPYLEVVNDVLEQYIIKAPDILDVDSVNDIYDTLLRDADNLSITLPFNLPLEELRLYLSHYELDLYDIYKLLKKPEKVQLSEKLKISEEELGIITIPDIDGVRSIFGNINPTEDYKVQDFITIVGISRRELDDLLKVEFISEISEIKVSRVDQESDDIQQYEEVLHIPKDGLLDDTRLSDIHLDLIHRFVRFWEKTSWSIREFDLVLNSMESAGLFDNLEDEENAIGNPHVLQVSELIIIQEALGLSVEEACAMVGDIPQTPIAENQKGMYERLFDIEKIFDEEINDEEIAPLLMAGLGISESELDALFILLRDSHFDLTLSIGLISTLYRHARIARGLSLSIEDFTNMTKLTLNGLPVSELDHIHQLIEFTSWLKSSPFTVSELIMILQGKESSTRKYRNGLNSVTTAVLEIQSTFETDRRSMINDDLKNRYKLTLSQMEDLKSSSYTISEIDLILMKSESLSATIYSNDINFLTTKIQDIENSIKLSKRGKQDLLNNYLQSTFNLTTGQLKDEILPYLVSIDIEGPEITRALNTVFSSDGEPANPSDFDELVVLVRELERMGLLFSKLQFSAGTITYFINNKNVFGIDDLKALTIDNLKSASFYKSLLDKNKEMEGEIGDVLKSYQTNLPAVIFHKEQIKTLSDLWQQPEEQIESLTDALALTFDSDASALETVTFLWKAQGVCQELGIRGNSLVKLTATDSEGLRAAREIAVGAFTFRYADEEIRKEKLEPYVDKINTLKRDALCALILARQAQLQEQFKISDRRDLYNYFLLDVEMSGCFRTSKLVAAISSVQLYVHRCLLNLERSKIESKPDVDPTRIPADEWEWRKNYRVWEANRRVFLYPENYIDPTLRDNKTHIFKELEEELLQEKITEDSAETAYKKYISQFAELTKLRYAGAYYHSIPNGFSVDLSMDGNKKTFKRFGGASGRYISSETADSAYYLFARTNVDPYQYYYRTYNHYKTLWGNWKKIELAIEANEISAVIHLGKLYIYWTEVNRKEINNIAGGGAESGGTIFKVYAKYSFLNENNKWSAPQRLYVGYTHFEDENAYWRIAGEVLLTGDAGDAEESDEEKKLRKIQEKKHDYVIEQFEKKVFRKPYAHIIKSIEYPINLSYIWSQNKIEIEKIKYTTEPFTISVTFEDPEYGHNDFDGPQFRHITLNISSTESEISIDEMPHPISAEISGPPYLMNEVCTLTLDGPNECYVAGSFSIPNSPMIDFGPDPVSVNSPAISYILKSSTFRHSLSKNEITNSSSTDIINQSDSISTSLQEEYNVAYTEDGNYHQYVEDGTSSFTMRDKTLSQYKWGQGHLSIPSANHVRLTTVLTDELSDILFAKGLDQFLSLETQQLTDGSQKLDFNGAYGEYYWEMYFHIPFLIANHLNANQKFKEAKWWYDRIFNPTDDESPSDTKPSDRNWQFREFRNLDIEKLKDMLVNSAAIEAYKKDPFNPHAIARLRLNSYQKAVVMKYIDNLIDWGDYLFAQDTRESINEANMLYQLAADILGKRPVKVGTCKTASDSNLTYEKIGPAIEKGSEFLITLENIIEGFKIEYDNVVKPVKMAKYVASLLENSGARPKTNTLAAVAKTANMNRVSGSFAGVTVGPGSTGSSNNTIERYEDMVTTEDFPNELYTDWTDADEYEDNVVTDGTSGVPGHDIVKQSVMAFCVPQNSNLLKYWDRVEDRLYKIRHCMNISGVRRSLAFFQPRIDPMLLIRARAAGLSLEDITDMLAESDTIPPYRFGYLVEKTRQFTQTVQSFGSSLLSALEKKDVEELTLLRSVHERNILKMSREIKKRQLKESQLQFKAMEDSLTNVQNRIDYYNGLIKEDLTGWETTQQVSKHTASVLQVGDGLFRLMAGIAYLLPEVGSPFAMKYGGKQVADSVNSYAGVVASAVKIAEAISASAGLEASFQRREQEWKQQLKIAQTEYNQVEKQMFAADIRSQIAEKDLEIHEESMDQADELNDFYKDKFTNLGLYNYMASTLNRLYREAYNMAYDMAMMTERAYQFERDDNTIFIANDNWQLDRAGLLAGERLLLQLQKMEQEYIENNVRTPEITQSFSLALLDASELIKLRQTGSCTIIIPEIAFEAYYPGQYKRLIKSVRISMPCVVGPYTNVSAKLTLKSSNVKVEKTDTLLTPLEIGKNTSISASSANSDTGMFEFSFRDERYLPFEGSGAISQWTVELPSTVRSFNYDTIPDVIMHISYTAKEGDRETAENNLATAITTYATETGLLRLFSLKHEFPNSFHQLLNPQDGGAQATEISVDSNHFPYLFIDKTLNITDAKVYLKPKKGMSISTTPININGANVVWPAGEDEDIEMPGSSEEKDKMKGGTLSINGRNPIDEWTINTDDNGLDGNVLEDILILIKYKIL